MKRVVKLFAVAATVVAMASCGVIGGPSAAKNETTRSTSDALSSLANNKDVSTAVSTVSSILGLLGK